MISNELNSIVDMLKLHGNMSFCDGASANQISLFEESNKVNLPSKYKEWLLFSDGGDLFLPAGVQLYGVSHEPIIDVNDDDRPSEDYTIIGALSTGDPVLCQNGSEKISIYDHETGKIRDDEVYSDFFKFLENLLSILRIE